MTRLVNTSVGLKYYYMLIALAALSPRIETDREQGVITYTGTGKGTDILLASLKTKSPTLVRVHERVFTNLMQDHLHLPKHKVKQLLEVQLKAVHDGVRHA